MRIDLVVCAALTLTAFAGCSKKQDGDPAARLPTEVDAKADPQPTRPPTSTAETATDESSMPKGKSKKKEDVGASPSKSSARPADAIAFGGHWYRIYNEKIAWHDAKKKCEALGGYLVCIEAQEEQAFLAKQLDGEYRYLGATDEEKEGDWKWINGSPWAYTSWYSGQPNNYGGKENYLASYDGGDWVDVDGEGDSYWMPKGFVCEWER